MFTRYLPWFLIAGLVFSLVSCGNPYGTPTKTFNRYMEAAKDKDQEKYMACYTDKTRELLAEIEQKSAEYSSETKKDQERFQNMTATIKKEEISGDTATLTVLMDNHEQELTFIKEKGNWKIDMSAELSAALEMMNKVDGMKKGMKNFLNKMKTTSE